MSNIQSVLEEKRLFPPSAEFTAKARLDADKLAALRAEAEKDPAGFWAELARKHLAWQTPFRTVLDDRDAPNYRWFTDGRTNASANCLDRHLGAKGDKIAIRFEAGEPFAHLLPLHRPLLHDARAEWRPLSETPELESQYRRWTQSRGHFLDELPDPDSAAAREQWQRGYFRGVDVDGCPAKEHRVKLRLPDFTRGTGEDG